MPAITIAQLENAATDVEHIATLANSTDLTATDRLGRTKKTMEGAIASIAAITDRGAWVTATAYAVKDVVEANGLLHICVIAHTSGATFAGDSAKWRVYEDRAAVWCGTAGGTANALTLSPASPIAAYTAGQIFKFIAGATGNSGAATVAISGLAPVAVQEIGSAVAGGEIIAGQMYELVHDGVAFQLGSLAFLHRGANSTVRPALDKLQEAPLSPQDNEAAADGVTDDLVELNATIGDAEALNEKNIRLIGDYLLSAAPTNPLGIEFDGPGRLLKSVTGGAQQINSYGDRGQYVTGREYLSSFHKRLMARSVCNIRFSGDSTTAGDSATTPYRIWELVPELATRHGLYGVTGTDAGHSGESTVEWLASHLATDLTANPDLYVIRWGINDPYASGDNLSVSQFITNIRTGLATLRAHANGALAGMSVVLMMPNSVSDTPGNRDEKWHEAIAAGMRQAARDYQCCFVDTYAYLRDSRNAADWMDDPYADGRHIHPNNVMNVWIASLLADAIFPNGLQQIAENQLRNIGGSFLTRAAADLPAVIKKGISIERSGAGMPYDGTVITINHTDNVQWQMSICYNATPTEYAWRIGQAGAWNAWQYVGKKSASALTLLNSWVNYAAYTLEAQKDHATGKVQLRGLIKSGTVTAGTVICTLPAGYRPPQNVWAVVACNTGAAVVYVATTGNVVIQSGTNGYLSLDDIGFLAA